VSPVMLIAPMTRAAGLDLGSKRLAATKADHAGSGDHPGTLECHPTSQTANHRWEQTVVSAFDGVVMAHGSLQRG